MDEFPNYPFPGGWALIPTHMQYAVYNYVMHGHPIGGFLTAVISDQPLSEVFAKADDVNGRAMLGWVKFLYNYFPHEAKGSLEAIRAWQGKGGILGK